MYDYIISGGTVVNPWGIEIADVAIKDGKVAGVGLPGTFESSSAKERVDASKLLVLPGAIDPHCHTNHLVPTAADAGLRSADATAVSKAAVYGGTTTIVDFAIWKRGETLEQTTHRKAEEFADCFANYAFHISFQGEIDLDVIEQVPDIIRAGHSSVKVWITNATPTRPRQMTSIGYVWTLLEMLQEAGGILAVHGEDDEIVMHAYERLEREGRTGFENIHLAHSTLSEALSFRRVMNLVERIGGAVYMVHVSAAEGVRAIAEARAKGLPVYGETLQHYLSFTADSYRRPEGALYHTYPSLKYGEDVSEMWDGLATGVLSTVATDEMCTTRKVKEMGRTIGDVTGGHVGVEVRLPLMYTEAVVKRGMRLERFVEIVSTNAAKILGMYPQKGVVTPGADADIVLLDPTTGRDITNADLHESDYTPWEGWRVEAWPKATFVGGDLVVRNGSLTVKRGTGSLVGRRIEDHVLNGPNA